MSRPTMPKLEQRLSALRNDQITPEALVFEKKCRDWLNQETNQDKRGTKASAIQRAYNACLWFLQAQRARNHKDSTIRGLAEKTVKGISHHEFSEICDRLRKLRGPISKAGKRIADQNRHDAERTIELGDGLELRQLRSMKSLQQVGRTLRNCTAKKGYAQEYLKDVRSGDAEMWALLEQQQPVFLLKVNPETREIDELEGEAGASPKLDCTLAFKVLNSLNVSGDNQEAFVEIGAFRSFRSGRPAVEPIEIEGCRYWIYVLRDSAEILVATKNPADATKRWSRFSLDCCNGWSLSPESELSAGPWSHLSEGSLLYLFWKHPALAEKLWQDT